MWEFALHLLTLQFAETPENASAILGAATQAMGDRCVDETQVQRESDDEWSGSDADIMNAATQAMATGRSPKVDVFFLNVIGRCVIFFTSLLFKGS